MFHLLEKDFLTYDEIMNRLLALHHLVSSPLSQWFNAMGQAGHGHLYGVLVRLSTTHCVINTMMTDLQG